MKSRTGLGWISAAPCLAVLLLLFLPSGAYAYLDPGTGSFIIQILIAALLGGVMVLKRTWARIASHGRRFLRLGPHDGAKDG